ncbi:MAG TPA: hypothetical protein VGJ20_01940 [Xanthobacteraceae bacterium]
MYGIAYGYDSYKYASPVIVGANLLLWLYVKLVPSSNKIGNQARKYVHGVWTTMTTRNTQNLSQSARIIRGFSRVGIGIAFVITLFCFFSAWNKYNAADYDFNRYACLLRKAGSPLYGAQFKQAAMTHSKCGLFFDFAKYDSISWSSTDARFTDEQIFGPRPIYCDNSKDDQSSLYVNGECLAAATIGQRIKDFSEIVGTTLMISLVVFGFFRGLGWMLAGFARD